MFGWLRNLFTRSESGRAVRAVRWDAARTDAQNKHIWKWADGLDADASNSPSVRRELRNRSRHEIANNPTLRGLVKTKVNDLIGTGPRLNLPEMLIGDRDINAEVAAKFGEWAKAVKLTRKLRTCAHARFSDGESFLIFRDNPGLRDPVTGEPYPLPIDIVPFEAEQIATPNLSLTDKAVDGIEFDASGNPKAYHLLKRHPGDTRGFGSLANDAERVPAEYVLHWFYPERPGQSRGVSELASSLSTWPEIRRFVKATLGAAETAADIALVLYNDAAPTLEDQSDASLWNGMEIAPRTAVTVPPGWKPEQMTAQHPTTTFGDFVRRLVSFAARPFLMPFNVAMGDSSNHNYSSGKLDILPYNRANDIEQSDVESEICDPIFYFWLRVAQLVEGYLPQEARARDYRPEPEWFWDEPEDIDSQKEAAATEIRIRSGQSSPWREHVRSGRDPRREDELSAQSYGIDVKTYRAALFAKMFGSGTNGSPTNSPPQNEPEEAPANAAA